MLHKFMFIQKRNAILKKRSYANVIKLNVDGILNGDIGTMNSQPLSDFFSNV